MTSVLARRPVAAGLRTRFLVAPVHGDKEQKLLGAPWETYLRGLDGQLLGQEIPQSEWI